MQGQVCRRQAEPFSLWNYRGTLIAALLLHPPPPRLYEFFKLVPKLLSFLKICPRLNLVGGNAISNQPSVFKNFWKEPLSTFTWIG